MPTYLLWLVVLNIQLPHASVHREWFKSHPTIDIHHIRDFVVVELVNGEKVCSNLIVFFCHCLNITCPLWTNNFNSMLCSTVLQYSGLSYCFIESFSFNWIVIALSCLFAAFVWSCKWPLLKIHYNHYIDKSIIRNSLISRKDDWKLHSLKSVLMLDHQMW